MSVSQSELIHFLQNENSVVYNNIAASTFFFWDQCLTLVEERELIWREKPTRVTFLYYIIRYLTFGIRVVETMFYTNISGILQPSHAGCVAWVWFEAFAGYPVFVSVEIVLIMRVYAFYGKNKVLLAVLLILFTVEVTASLIILAVGIPKFDVQTSTLPSNINVGACIVLKTAHVFPNYWIPGLAFESILFFLLIAMFIHKRRNNRMNNTRLLIVFVRDGAWGFAVIFGALLWCELAFKHNPQMGDIALTWLYSALGFVGSHLILNLRKAAQEQLRRPDEVQLPYLRASSEPSSPQALSPTPGPRVIPGTAF